MTGSILKLVQFLFWYISSSNSFQNKPDSSLLLVFSWHEASQSQSSTCVWLCDSCRLVEKEGSNNKKTHLPHKSQGPSVSQPGCSVSNLCSLLSGILKVDEDLLWHCREEFVKQNKRETWRKETNQWGPVKWFLSLWTRVASFFCFSILFPHYISLPCLLFFPTSSSIIYTFVFISFTRPPYMQFPVSSLSHHALSLSFLKHRIRTHVFLILHWSHMRADILSAAPQVCWIRCHLESQLHVCYLKCQHPAIIAPLFNLQILQTIYTHGGRDAHHYGFLSCYSSKRRRPGVIQCSTP